MKVIGITLCIFSLWFGAWLFDSMEGPYKVASIGTAAILFFIGAYFMENSSDCKKNRTTSLGPY